MYSRVMGESSKLYSIIKGLQCILVMGESSKLYSIIKGLQCILESWQKVQNYIAL